MNISEAAIDEARKRAVKAFKKQEIPYMADGIPWSLPFELSIDIARVAKASSERFVAELKGE